MLQTSAFKLPSAAKAASNVALCPSAKGRYAHLTLPLIGSNLTR
jgi:hypothetical protein